MHYLAAHQCDLGADHEVPRRAEAMATGTAVIRGEDAANGAVRTRGRIEGEPLALASERGIQRIEAGMNKMFGTKIKINYATGPAMGSIGNQLLAEFKANRPSATDVYFGNGPYAIPLIDAGMLPREYAIVSA